MAKVPVTPPSRYQSLSVTSVDKHIGQRIKLRRNYLKMSQDKLGQSIGLTFQQIQKYEKGLNHINVSRLWDISRTLQVDINYFFENLPQNAEALPNNHSSIQQNQNANYSEKDLTRLNLLRKINNPQIMRIIDNLLNTLAFPNRKKEND